MLSTDTGDTTNENSENNSLRESLITTAVNFLHNDNVQRSPINQKQKFLRSKGLNEHEIQIAFERAGVFTNDPNNTIINLGINSSQPKNLVVQHQQQQQLFLPTAFTKIKDFISSAAVISSIIYVVYTVYKRFIEPFLFGRKKKPSIEETLEKIDNKVETQINNVNSELIRVREQIQANNQIELLKRELNNFKSDLDAIKGLLLNSKQFASGFSTIIPPSIPAWQLTSQHHTSVHDKNEDADGSGSGSSETEVVIKNSDSSIEIM